MLNNWLLPQNIKIVDKVEDWKQAVYLSADLLLKDNSISMNYIDAIYASHEKYGPYYVLGKGIAMPHARPENGVNKQGLSLLVIKQGVIFGSQENDPIYIVLTLAAKDGNSHLTMMENIVDLLSNDDDINKIKQAQKESEIMDIINKY